MKRLPFVIVLIFLLFSCNQSSNSNNEKVQITDDTISMNQKDTANSSVSKKDTDSLEHERNAAVQPNIFESIVGKWIFVKSFLPPGRSIDDSSFTISRKLVESAGYAYFIHFSGDAQEWLLSKEDTNTVSYSDGYGTFKYDRYTGYLQVVISDTSDAEYRKIN